MSKKTHTIRVSDEFKAMLEDCANLYDKSYLEITEYIPGVVNKKDLKKVIKGV